MSKIILFALSVTIAQSAKLTNAPEYRQVQNPTHQDHVPVHHQDHTMINKPVGILNQESEINPDGSFHNVWESENGIKVQEEGTVRELAKNVVAHTVTGRIAYTDNEDNVFTLTYVADENGFRPEGSHLPTPPPIPLAIARALEYIAAHPSETNSAHKDEPVVEAN
uniref:Cuticular protein 6 n=1 Tax=Microplitis mediator TaxID=375433 RepID=A0A650DLG2_9HYME|nr:cuticular protein 6 [Microplitis mediator]